MHYATGLFSTIYKTRVASPPQILALKLTTPSQCQPPHNPKREARILTAAKHPNIIPLLETHNLSSSHLLLVFPFQPLDLATLLLKHQPLGKQQAQSIIHDLFSALAHLHSLGIIHRDIKPSNILLSSTSTTPTAYLADFGIAWLQNDPASEPPAQKITDIGTTSYRPPELLFGRKNYSYEVDLWAAGCVVAEIVEGRGHDWTLFDAGELGSELALVKSIFETLGTPDKEVWPEAKELPDWGKMTFVDFPGKEWVEILPNASAKGRDLVGQLVRYQSSERSSADEVSASLYRRWRR
jgi:cyclin-dependent kinase